MFYRCKKGSQSDYALALRELGEFARAEEILNAIDMEPQGKVFLPIHVVYCGNRMDLCVLTGKWEEAALWYTKAMRRYAELSEGKMKQKMCKVLLCMQAEYCYLQQDYEQALAFYAQVEPENRRGHVEQAMGLAKVYYAIGQKDVAAANLSFVLNHGNYSVVEARVLWEKIQAGK